MEKTFTVPILESHGFNLWDAESGEDWDGDWENDDWGDIDLGVAEGVITVFTPRGGGDVPVTIAVMPEHEVELGDWSRVLECSIAIPSGRVVALDNMDEVVAEVEVEPGTYRAVIYCGRYETVEYDSSTGNDHYRAVLAPFSGELEPRVLKDFEGEYAG